VQSLIAFNDEITVKCSLSELALDFEDSIRKVVPSSTTHPWDAEEGSRRPRRVRSPGRTKEFPNAKLRILVTPGNDDVGSSATPLQVLQAMIDAKVVCDFVIISSRDECKRFAAVCHLTGGLSFRPPSVVKGLDLFEHETFLCYEKRKKLPHFRGSINAQTIRDRAAGNFNIRAELTTTVEATGRPIAVPRYILFQNRSLDIPDARRRRIHRALHQTAAVQDETVCAHDRDGNEVAVYDPSTLATLFFMSHPFPSFHYSSMITRPLCFLFPLLHNSTV
jgi:hypothetical protein